MAGIIVGAFGFQRSGKTLLSYLISEHLHIKNDIPVYSNMTVDGWTKLSKLSDLPFNYEPKILILDECYFFMDSRLWQDNAKSSIFFNTVGKQNILLILTSIRPDMIDVRLRKQLNYMFLVKSDKFFINYKIVDCQRMKSSVFSLPKKQELFDLCKYDTKQVPDYFDLDIEEFLKKVYK